MPKFEKSSPELVARFDAAAARFPEAERRKMFGYPALFVGGNLVTGLFAQSWMIRLGDEDRAELAGGPGRRAVRTDGRQTDEGLCDVTGGRRRRRRRARRVGGSSHRLRSDTAREIADADPRSRAGVRWRVGVRPTVRARCSG